MDRLNPYPESTATAAILIRLDQAERMGQWVQVEQLCKQALQRDSDNWSLWQRLASSHEARSEWAQAETLWRHLTQRFSSRPEPYLALAALQRRRGDPDGARVVLQEAERRVGDSQDLRRSLAVIDDPWVLGESVPQLNPGASASELALALQLVQQHLDAGRLSEAEAVLVQILQAKPLAGRVHLQLAQLRRRRNDGDALIQQLEPLLADPRAADLPERLSLVLLLAQALQQRQRWQQADSLLAALSPDPSACQNLDLALARCECAMGRDDDLGARAWLERCLQLDPDCGRAQVLLGQLSLRLGDWVAAIAALTRAVALDPTNPDSAALLDQARQDQLWQRGEAALRQAAWKDAREAYRHLLSYRPGHRQALERLELLASLNPDRLVSSESSAQIADPEAAARDRLIQFSAHLDRIEIQLNTLGGAD